MYDYLRVTIGEKAFFNGLKKYYKDYKFKNATPGDLVGVYEKTGTDTNGFFKSFFEGKVVI
jgi:aminopeptidase N